MKSNDIATFAIRLLQCRYFRTKVTPLLRSLWPSPMCDRYRGVRLYTNPLLKTVNIFSLHNESMHIFNLRTSATMTVMDDTISIFYVNISLHFLEKNNSNRII